MNDISIIPGWIPRCENELAYIISKIIDYDDWYVSFEFFHYLDQLWGPHTIDCFPDFRNRKISGYNSHFWNPDYETVAAFSQNWSGEKL